MQTSATDGREPKTVWLIGEQNPYGSDPRYALYPLPPNAAGGRLARVLGLDDRAYLRQFERRNLLTAAKWSVPAARAAADVLLAALPETAKLVLLGARVSAAFKLDFRADLFRPQLARVGHAAPRDLRVLVLPHPSGLSREWNDPEAADKTRRAVAELTALEY